MGLFLFDPISPGSPFFLPKGAIIYNQLVEYMRRLYRRYGFDEVITPQVFKNELWQTSGHWDNFRENMFLTSDREGGKLTRSIRSPEGWRKGYGVKPMNCPGHTFIYRAEKRSYRDLPLRIADFGRLHRAERSGTLHGLTRVRTMAQDDAHVFCAPEQIGRRDRPQPADGARRLSRRWDSSGRIQGRHDARKASRHRGAVAAAARRFSATR